MNKLELEFEAKLNEAYDGTVKPLTRYVNERSTLCFHCSNCGVKFFNKASYMVGKEHQRHACNKPYGTVNGERTYHVSTIKKTKNKNGKGHIKQIIQQLDQLIEQGVQPKSIARQLELNYHLVNDYIKGKEQPKGEVKVIELTEFAVNKRGRKAFKDPTGRLYFECNSCEEVKDSYSFQNLHIGFLGKHPDCKKCMSNKRAKG